MTIEELEKQVSDLQAEKEAMNAKNKELLAEVKKLKNVDDCLCPQRGGQQKIKANLKGRVEFWRSNSRHWNKFKWRGFSKFINFREFQNRSASRNDSRKG